MARDERPGIGPTLDLKAVVAVPEFSLRDAEVPPPPAPTPSAAPAPPAPGRPGKVRLSLRPGEPEPDEPDLLAPASIRGWAVSAITHGLVLLALAFIVLRPPAKPDNAIDTRLAGEVQGSVLGEELTGALGIDEPLAMPETTPQFSTPTPTLSAAEVSPIIPPRPRSGQAGPALTGAGKAGEGDGFGVAKFGRGGERINDVDVKVGNPQFTLIWDSPADLDLHVLEPDGSHLFWQNKKGVRGGDLDVDDVDGYGPENVYWGGGLDKGNGPPGEYKWFVYYYGSIGGLPVPTRWKVRVKLNGEYTIYEGKLNRIDQQSRTYSLTLDPTDAVPSAETEPEPEPKPEAVAANPKTPPKPTAREGVPRPVLDADGWRVVEPPGAGFRVAMPEPPMIETQQVPTIGGDEGEAHIFRVDRGEGGYSVSYSELPPGLADRGATTVLELAATSTVGALGATLKENRAVAVASIPGRELAMDVPDRVVAGGGKARARLFVVGDRLYNVSATGTDEFVARRETDKFLDSFQPAPAR